MFTSIKYLRQLMWKSQLLSTVAKLEKTPQFCTRLSWDEPPRQLVLLWFAGLAIFANWCYHGDIISGCLLGGGKRDSHLSIYRSISGIGVDMCVHVRHHFKWSIKHCSEASQQRQKHRRSTWYTQHLQYFLKSWWLNPTIYDDRPCPRWSSRSSWSPSSTPNHEDSFIPNMIRDTSP